MATPSATTDSSPLLKGIAELWKSGKGVDFIVTCGKRSWMVHSTVLIAQSDYFMKACEGGSSIDLGDDDESAVAAMLYYFYHSDYDEELSKPTDTSISSFHAKVYQVADKYLVEPLATTSVRRFTTSLAADYRTDAFAEVITYICETTITKSHPLRIALLELTASHAKALFAEDDKHSAFKAVAGETPKFAAEVVQMVLGARTDVIEVAELTVASLRYQCPRCLAQFGAIIPLEDTYAHRCYWPNLAKIGNTGNSYTGKDWMKYAGL